MMKTEQQKTDGRLLRQLDLLLPDEDERRHLLKLVEQGSILDCKKASPDPVEFLTWIFENCKVIHWPKNGEYPIEHAPAAKKDSRMFLEWEFKNSKENDQSLARRVSGSE